MRLAPALAIGLLAAMALSHCAMAQTSCTPQTQSQLLNLFSDAAPRASITPQVMRNFVCSTPGLTTPVTYNLRANCGAVGDGIADDSGALKQCLGNVQAQLIAGIPARLYIPAGIYLIKSTNGTMPTISGAGAYIQGEGPHKTFMVLDPGYSGDLFSVSNAASTLDIPGNTVNPSTDANGYSLVGLTVIGNITAAQQQNAIRLYDLDDEVLIRDVSVYSLNGQCLSAGRTLNSTNAYVRESSVWNLKCWNTGTASQAAVEFTSHGGTEGTNEIMVYDLNVYHAAGTGVVVSAPNVAVATAGIRFFGLRVENSVADGIDVGLGTDVGQVHDITFFGLEAPAVASGTFALKITTGGAFQPYGINVYGGTIGPGLGGGIDIDNARLVQLVGFGGFSTTGTNITIGTNGGTDLRFDGYGLPGWTWSISSGFPYNLNPQSPFPLAGFPGTNDRVGAVGLRGSGNTASAIRLTMDGATAAAYNCFAPKTGQALAFSVDFLAQDTTTNTKWQSWHMPIAYLSAWSGPATATLTAGTPATISNGTLTGSSVTFSADTTNGCVNLSWVPPTGNTDTWNVSALISFTRSP